MPVSILSDKRRIVSGIDQLPQTGHAGTGMPGKKRLGSRLVGGLSRTDPHRISLIVAGQERARAHDADQAET